MTKVITAGQTFGKLTILGPAPSLKKWHRAWRCRCECGNDVIVITQSLNCGRTKSCGCLRASNARGMFTTHGMSRRDGRTSPEYRIWTLIKDRCYNSRSKAFARYGGRDITMCDRWRTDFAAFMVDMGPRPSPQHSVDRIDNDRGYEPDNCRWATPSQQSSNQRTNKLITFDGETRTQADTARAFGLTPYRLYQRLKLGWPLDRALHTPPLPKGKRFHSVLKPFL